MQVRGWATAQAQSEHTDATQCGGMRCCTTMTAAGEQGISWRASCVPLACSLNKEHWTFFMTYAFGSTEYL